VSGVGLEPTIPREADFKSAAYASSATRTRKAEYARRGLLTDTDSHQAGFIERTASAAEADSAE